MRVEKTLNAAVEVQQEQSAFAEKASVQKPDARATIVEEGPRQRHLELWLGVVYESIRSLADFYPSMTQYMGYDKEVQSGLGVMQRITRAAGDALEPMVQKYGTDLKYGRETSEALRQALFPGAETASTPYGVILTLTGFVTYTSHIEAQLSALVPVSQALWDGAFLTAVNDAKSCIERVQKWAKHQLAVRSAQTLIVPSSDVIRSDMQWPG